MSDAETSAYLPIAAGAFWILVGIVGLRGTVKSNDTTVDRYPEEVRVADGDSALATGEGLAVEDHSFNREAETESHHGERDAAGPKRGDGEDGSGDHG